MHKRRNMRRRKRENYYIKIMISGVVLVVLIAIVVPLFSRGKSEETNTKNSTATIVEAEKMVTQPVTTKEEIFEPVKPAIVGNVDITGLTQPQAREKLIDHYKWDMNFRYGEEILTLDNPLLHEIDKVLEEIYTTSNKEKTENYELDLSGIEENIKYQITEWTAKKEKKPIEAQLTGRDKERKEWIYSGGENGTKVNVDKAVQSVMNLVNKEEFEGIIEVEKLQIAPQSSTAQVKDQYKVIGQFTTKATNNQNRNNNIKLAVNALDGLVIFPGEEFSFNTATGNRTIERGYKPAGAYRNGVFVEEPGGGVCQVSSTLYNAVIFAGIATTERHAHSFEPSYVIPGEDAMVSYDGYSGPDLRFINRQNTSIAIRAVFEGQNITISIIAKPILEDGVKRLMKSEKIKDIDPPAPTYVEDQTLQPDEEVEAVKGTKGSTWRTYLVTEKDGVVIEEDYFHSSTYRGKPGVVKRNTSGVVIPKETAKNPQESENVPAETMPVENLPGETIPVENTNQEDNQVTQIPGIGDGTQTGGSGNENHQESGAEAVGPGV